MFHGLGVLGHGCSWGCPSSQHPHGKAWSLPGHWIWLFFIMGERYGESQGALLQIPAPSLVLVQACAPPPSCPLARKLQTLLVPNDHHLPLLGFAAPLFLCQLVVGLCCWLLFAGVSALDQVRAWSGQCLGTSRVGWVCPGLASSRSVRCNSTSKPVLLCWESQGRWQERTVTASTAIPGEEGDACSPPSKLLRRRSEFGLGLMSGAALPSCVHRDGAAVRVCSSEGAFWRRVVAVSMS